MHDSSFHNKHNEKPIIFSLETVQHLYETQELIDFDIAWQVLGYSTKSNAKRMLGGYFDKEFDYFVQKPEESLELLPHGVFITSEKNSKGGRPTEKIYLTVNCFKEMGMLANSEKGKQIRKYFLQCEEFTKKSIKAIPQLQLQATQMQQQLTTALEAIATLQSQIQPLLPADSNSPPPGWNSEVWERLQPQDKRHFRYLYCRKQFMPSNQLDEETEALHVLSQQAKQQQQSEMRTVLGEASKGETARLEELKDKVLAEFDARFDAQQA